MVKKILLGVINLLSVVLIVCAVLVLGLVLLTPSGQAPSLLGYSAFRTLTGSMEPEIPVQAVVVVQATDPASLQVGDVISFYSPDPALNGSVNTHRIYAIEMKGDERTFVTKGDANAIPDRWAVAQSGVIGKVVWHSAFLGRAASALIKPAVFLPLILVPLLLAVFDNLRKTVKTAKHILDEEDAAYRVELEEAIARRRAETERKQEGETPHEEESADRR